MWRSEELVVRFRGKRSRAEEEQVAPERLSFQEWCEHTRAYLQEMLNRASSLSGWHTVSRRVRLPGAYIGSNTLILHVQVRDGGTLEATLFVRDRHERQTQILNQSVRTDDDVLSFVARVAQALQ